MSLGRGEDVVIAEYNSVIDAWVLWGCGRSSEFGTATDSIETSVSGSGNFATYMPTKRSGAGSFEGLTNYNGAGIISLPDLRQRQLDAEILTLRVQRTAVDGISIYADVFDCFIESVSDTGAIDGMNTFQVSYKVTGPIVQSFTPVEILANVKRKEYTAAGGETSFNLPQCIGKRILAVHRDGIGAAKLIIAGVPVDKECLINSVSIVDGAPLSIDGDFDFAVPFEIGEEAYVLYR